MSVDGLLLDVQGLAVDITRGSDALRVVRGVSLKVRRGECVGLVGESGSGKSMTAFAIMRLFPSPRARVGAGSIVLDGTELTTLAPEELRRLRGARMGMVFQDPSSYLDPLMPVGRQIAAALRAHGRTEGIEARVLELIDLMELPNAAQVARKYPHELSGGMRQRILIAAALAMRPALLIADEPTTALDVTVQAGILSLLTRLRRELDLGVLLITHDLAVVAETCQRVYVMYAGEIVEEQPVASLFAAPRHPYTQGLLGSILSPQSRAHALFSVPGGVPIAGQWPTGCRFHPRCPIASMGRCDREEPALRTAVRVMTAACAATRSWHAMRGVCAARRCLAEADPMNPDRSCIPLLEARMASRLFPVRGTGGLWRRRIWQRAVDGVSVQLHAGEVLAVVGESGSGKTTLGRMLLGLTTPSEGAVLYEGQDLAHLRGEPWRRFRRDVQVVFQDTGGSLNPRHTIAQSVALPLRHNHGESAAAAAREVDSLLDQVGLPPTHFRHRLPHELSGGQRQRVGLARALASRPRVIVADEPVSALDVSIRAQILRLMWEMQRQRGLAYLFITHDLGVVRALADRVIVMYQGRVVESADADTLFARPQHEYTRRLLAATPVPDPSRQRGDGGVLSESDGVRCLEKPPSRGG